MDQKKFNERVTMSLLRQCAWVWEHCTKIENEGEFTFKELMQGFGRNAHKSKPGYVIVDTDLCNYWDVFNKMQPIDGLDFDSDQMLSRMTFLKDDGYDFSFSFPIDIVYDVARDLGCPSLLNKMRFCNRNGERWSVLPDVKQTKPKNGKVKTVSIKKPAPEPLSLAEQLRQVLMARMAA